MEQLKGWGRAATLFAFATVCGCGDSEPTGGAESAAGGTGANGTDSAVADASTENAASGGGASAAPSAGRAGGASVGPELPAGARLAADPWIRQIFSVCVEDRYYDRDTSDLLPILVEKLVSGREDPLKRSIEELGALGEEAVPELRRLLDTQLNDASRAGSIKNTLGALSQNATEAAAEQLCRALDHPHRAIRTVALRGLSDGPVPVERFERLRLVSRVGGNDERSLAIHAMHHADPQRAEALILTWLEKGELERIEDSVLPLLIQSAEPETLAGARAIIEDLDPIPQVWLAGVLARNGVERGVELLREALVSELPLLRGVGLQAASAAGRWDELIAVVDNETDPGQRAAALAALHSGLVAVEAGDPLALAIAPEPTQEEAAWARLRAALNSADGVLANEARAGLVLLGDDEALSRSLADLDGSPATLTAVLPGFRARLAVDPSVGERMLARLRDRIASEEHLPWNQRLAPFQALSVVPGRAAAELMMEYAERAAADGAVMSGVDGFRWFCVHATNTGVEGRKYLAELLAAEPDPVRRVSLTFAIAGERDELARSILRERLEDDSLEPLERLYVASNMANLGPAADVAPRLKRAAVRATDPDERRGLQCLLWYWY